MENLDSLTHDLVEVGQLRAAADQATHEATRTLHDTIRAAHKAGMGQAEIAKHAGITRQAVHIILGRSK